jgi:hypothetical protein
MQIFSFLFVIALSSFQINFDHREAYDSIDIHQLWMECKLDSIVPFNIFNIAFLGYNKIENLKKKNLLTIVDYSLPSTEKRFFVIDLANKKLLFKCLVAHGKNSGDNIASSFSNDPRSLKSALGFYITAETYSGKHGYSLRLDGLEKNINDNARSRDIVIHGARYISETFVKQYGRLGRSWACLAVPSEISKELIDTISNGSCLFIYADDKFYRENSTFFHSPGGDVRKVEIH